jgi:N-acetylglucosaminyldiphosphoundecaprenol N-acetyl-beta-D-mannosaminyltransferase
MNQKNTFIGLEISSLQLEEVTHQLRIDGMRIGIAYHLVNAYTITLAAQHPNYFKILREDLNICDGKPLEVVMRLRGSSLKQIRGADLMREVLSDSESLARHFFLGSTEDVLNDLAISAKSRNPRIKIVGQFSPEFKTEFDAEIDLWVEQIERSGASIVWVGLGTPKQDYVVHRIARSLPVHALAVGAAFDFLSKNQKEAPLLLRNFGLEWIFRLLKEPKRLAARYLIGNFKFLKIVLMSSFKTKKDEKNNFRDD